MIVLFTFFTLLILGLRIGVVVGISGIVGIMTISGFDFMSVVPQKIFNGLNLFPFLAMPFFILAGEIMNHIGITSKIINFANVLVGHKRGGLAHANMISSVFFAGVSGAATSDAAAFGRTLVPAMVKAGYDRPFACAVTAAGSIIGPTIPPSGLMVVYGSLMGVSIGGLFASGILPGIAICIACMVVITIVSKRKNYPMAKEKAGLKDIFEAFKEAYLALIMPLIILGGIIFGVFTPTEAASIAVAYALFLGVFVYRNLNFQALSAIILSTARICGVIFLIIASASILGWYLSFEQIPQALTAAVISITDNPHLILLIIILFLLAVGMIMDITAMLIILAPILVPITIDIGIDPLHAGIIFVLALNISLMTPPIGACLFVLSSVTGEKMERIAASLWPFLIVEIGILFLFAYSPAVALFIPRILGFVE
ncbi:MAG: TRAP transporter large permease [Campylobacteraceae bacterium]|nr:TRAP transporter large permease [Campylobacteraceae bacterium]